MSIMTVPATPKALKARKFICSPGFAASPTSTTPSPRTGPYRNKMSPVEAVQLMWRKMGPYFQSDLIQIFLEMFKKAPLPT